MQKTYSQRVAGMSLKVKAITFIIFLILAVGASLGWYFLSQTRGVLTTELQKRALSLTQNLAHNSKYGILTEDDVILQDLIKGILREDDVLYVLITNADGEILAQAFKPDDASAANRPSMRAAREHAAALAPRVRAPSLHYHVLNDYGIYHVAVPVETTAAAPNKREQQLSTAMALIGAEGEAEGAADAKGVRHGSVQTLLSLDAMQANVRQTFVTGIALTLGIIFIGVAISFAFCAYTLSPVQAIARAAEMIATGDLSQRVEAKSRDELGVLASTFNHMTESLDRMTQAQNRRLAELSALHDIGLVISSTLDLDSLIDLTLNAIHQHLGYERPRLFLTDVRRQELGQGRIVGVSDEIREHLRGVAIPLQPDGGFYAQVALSGEAILIEDLEPVRDQGYAPLAELLRADSLLVAPLKVGERVLGILAVDNGDAKYRLTEVDLSLLSTLAYQMAIAIANASTYRQLQQLNTDLEEKVQQRTEELRLEQEKLQQTNFELEIANRHKSEFLANMSHELRTPLNAIIGFSEVLIEQMFGEVNDKQEEYLNDILSSGTYLLSLINDILDLSKIEAGRLELELSVFDLKQLLESSLVMVKERALSHGIALSLDVSDDIDTLMADERKVKQILYNLLSNAVKFTPSGGQVGIRARRAAEGVQVAVWDTGIGIAPDDQARIFEEFQQVGGGLTAKTEGTGLGLALTRKFVDLHGGALRLESAPGQGSVFTFSLPVRASALEQAQPPALQSAPLAAETREPPTVGPLVLLIEDDPKASDLLCIYLAEAGYQVEIARDGAEGLEKVAQRPPVAIVLDVLMPRLDGWTFLTQVKANPATRHIPVVVASIVDQKGKGFALGAADYLVKPVQKEALLKTLADFRLLAKRETAAVKILVIDDNPQAAELIAAHLEPEGFDVLRAYGGEDGIEMARAQRPDLIILDLLMPVINGFDVLERLHASPDTAALPVVVYTAKQLSDDEQERLRGRVACFAQKGAFDQATFVGMIGDAVNRALEGRA